MTNFPLVEAVTTNDSPGFTAIYFVIR